MRPVATTRPSRSARSGRPVRRLGAVASLALVSALAVGCGDDSDGGDGGDGGGSDALSDDQVATAALSIDNLGADWTEKPAEEDDDSTAPGCLADVDASVEDIDPASEVEKTFGHGEVGLPQVQTGVASFEDEEAFAETFDDAQAALSECTSAQGTDEDGTGYDLTISSDEEAVEGVDDQLNLVASGTITTPEGQEVGFHLHMTMARIDNNVALIATSDFNDAATLHASLVEVGVDRLDAVVAGEEPAATTVPAPA